MSLISKSLIILICFLAINRASDDLLEGFPVEELENPDNNGDDAPVVAEDT